MQLPGLIERGRVRVQEFFETLDQQLGGQRYIAGDVFSMADITGVCAVDFAVFCRLPIPERCSHVLRWHAEVSARPSVANNQ